MLPRQFSIRSLLLMVALAAVCLTIHRVYHHWYLQNYSGYSLYLLLGTQVHNGDTFEEVAGHFGKAVKVDLSKEPSMQRVWDSRGWTILPGDEFWRFRHSTRNGVTLQFRDGRVVNFQPSDYADADALAKLNRAPIPPRWLRRGVWPVCLLIFIVGSCVLVLMEKKTRREASKK
jgi:hypothetical protein